MASVDKSSIDPSPSSSSSTSINASINCMALIDNHRSFLEDFSRVSTNEIEELCRFSQSLNRPFSMMRADHSTSSIPREDSNSTLKGDESVEMNDDDHVHEEEEEEENEENDEELLRSQCSQLENRERAGRIELEAKKKVIEKLNESLAQSKEESLKKDKLLESMQEQLQSVGARAALVNDAQEQLKAAEKRNAKSLTEIKLQKKQLEERAWFVEKYFSVLNQAIEQAEKRANIAEQKNEELQEHLLQLQRSINKEIASQTRERGSDSIKVALNAANERNSLLSATVEKLGKEKAVLSETLLSLKKMKAESREDEINHDFALVYSSAYELQQQMPAGVIEKKKKRKMKNRPLAKST